MCGIVGYVGPRPAAPFLMEGLSKLQYRGYDSAGIAVIGTTGMDVRKRAGHLSVLENDLKQGLPTGQTGIGHTRWATHGVPSDRNAHPHLDCTGDVAVIHNGIIENYQQLRRELAAKGHVFQSETDTETIAHLVEEAFQGDLLKAVQAAMARLRGAYALAVLHRQTPGEIVAARIISPLIVGLGDGENYLASDIPAVIDYTRRVIMLDDGEVAHITTTSVNVYDLAGKPIAKQVLDVTWDAETAAKGGHPHFMIKEIMEQPEAFRSALRGRLAGGRVQLEGMPQPKGRIFIVACGTSYHAGLVGKSLIEGFARVPVECDLASEFRYRAPLVRSEDLVIVVSQSGETADTLAAMREGKRLGATVLAITNVVGSSIDREADFRLHTRAGPEVAVASSKAYTTQLLCLTLYALWLGAERGEITTLDQERYVEALLALPDQAEQVLRDNAPVRALADVIARSDDAFYIGRGLDNAVAMEGQLKLKEISYVHAEALAAGELKHGTLALIQQGTPVIALATQSHLIEKMVSNIQEVRARGGSVTTVASDEESVSEVSDGVLPVPKAPSELMPVLAVLPLQLLAYYVAVARGNDVDQPRNLAKSVTVE